jgi:hypothetical protein
VERRDTGFDAGLTTLLTAAAGVTDPEEVIAAALRALPVADSEDDTCLVALQVLGQGDTAGQGDTGGQGDAASADSTRPSDEPRSQR